MLQEACDSRSVEWKHRRHDCTMTGRQTVGYVKCVKCDVNAIVETGIFISLANVEISPNFSKVLRLQPTLEHVGFWPMGDNRRGEGCLHLALSSVDSLRLRGTTSGRCGRTL